MSTHGPGGPGGPAGPRSAFGFVPPRCAGQAVPRAPAAPFGFPFAAAAPVFFPHVSAATADSCTPATPAAPAASAAATGAATPPSTSTNGTASPAAGHRRRPALIKEPILHSLRRPT
ncbi:hypothetical protein [Streptomyces erythrochromogenes]|uniref:hypothetical protein n=1 Tax=Streptomyces erythrochromogenes TaxID=285574 RepID=UPI0033D0111E